MVLCTEFGLLGPTIGCPVNIKITLAKSNMSANINEVPAGRRIILTKEDYVVLEPYSNET
jgi:hypothetical protein